MAEAHALAALAATSCDTCAAYHGTWRWLRLLGLAATPRRHDAFYEAWLTAGTGDDVLVCGAADEVMAELVVDAFAAAGRAPRITVLDRCPTPIERCRQFAAEAGLDLELVVAEVLRHRPTRPHDLICTHSLLPILEPDQRRRAADRWHGWLRPGGRVVTVARVAEGGAAPARPEAFAEAVRERAAEVLAPLGVDPDELAVAAAAYARTTIVRPFGSLREVEDLFTAAGFTPDHLELVTVGGSLGASVAHPGTARPATYAEVVARR